MWSEYTRSLAGGTDLVDIHPQSTHGPNPNIFHTHAAQDVCDEMSKLNEHTYLHVHDGPPEYDWVRIQRARQIKEDAAELLRCENAQPAVRLQLIFGVVLFVLCLLSLLWAVWDDYKFKSFMRDQGRCWCTQPT